MRGGEGGQRRNKIDYCEREKECGRGEGGSVLCFL